MDSRRRLAAPALVAAALVAQAGLASPAHAAGPRFASPTGTSAQTCLTAATACNIEKAIGSASSGDDITLLPGVYTTATVLTRSVSNLNIHGAPGQASPVINSSASAALSLPQSATGAKVSDLVINHTGGAYGLNLFTTGVTVQRVEVHSTGPVACSPGMSGVVRDTVCVTTSTASGAIALDDSWSGGTGRLVLRNVTAVATGPASYGVRADADGSGTNLDVDARNVIAFGTAADVRSTLKAGATNVDSDVFLQSSNYDTTEVGPGGSVTAAGTSTNQTALPVFADAAGHQAPSSPTINAGTVDASTGTVDVEGEARPYQGAMDIGADEFYPDVPPPDTLVSRTPKSRTHQRRATFVFSATEPGSFVCKLDRASQKPCASPYKKRVKRYGKHRLTIWAVDAVGNVDPTPATYVWKVRKKHRGKPPHHRG